MSFSALGLDAALVRSVKELGFTRPTPIQHDAIPPALEGRDVLACAMTGSGKTAAFLLPILHRILAKRGGKPRGTTRALVLTPTRELAAQIEQHFDELAVHTPISGAAVFGGVGMGPQEHAFRTGVDILVATPGRLLDHLRHPYAKLDKLEVLVLDEADRMLDMGFLPDIQPRPQASAAQASDAVLLRHDAGADRRADEGDAAHRRRRSTSSGSSQPAIGITQAIYPVSQELKPALLRELLDRNAIGNALVFTRTKHRANRLFESCEKAGIYVARIHGNRSQSQRTDALEGFKTGRYRVLVATDIAARGIDVEALGHVINFDVPAMPEDYIHRVGRTARAELTGEALTFVSPEEEHDLGAIEKAVGKRAAARHAPRLRLQAAAGGALRDSDRRAYRGDPEPEGGRSRAGEGQAGAPERRLEARERRTPGSTPPARPHPSRGPSASRRRGRLERRWPAAPLELAAGAVRAAAVVGAVPAVRAAPAAGAADRPRAADCKLRIAWCVIALGTVTHYASSLSPIS